MTKEEVVEKFVENLEYTIPEESGTYNKFCPNCFYRNGHPLIWCRHCGTKMVVYTQQEIRPTWRSYLERAISLDVAMDRAGSFMFHFTYYENRKGSFKRGDFNFVWYKDSPKCTTPMFAKAICDNITSPNWKKQL